MNAGPQSQRTPVTAPLFSTPPCVFVAGVPGLKTNYFTTDLGRLLRMQTIQLANNPLGKDYLEHWRPGTTDYEKSEWITKKSWSSASC